MTSSSNLEAAIGMSKKTSQSISSGADSINIAAGGDVQFIYEGSYPTELVDQKIRKEVARIRRARFFPQFDAVDSALALGGLLLDGSLSSGSDAVRSQALAWCARLASQLDEVDKAEEFFARSKALGGCSETEIAKAFLTSKKGERARALAILARMNTPASRSASLMIVANQDGPESAFQWMKDAGIDVGDLDSDGKSFLLTIQLKLGYWDAALETIRPLTTVDFEETPILYRLTAMTKLSVAVPSEFRPVVLAQVPFEASSFRLASDATSMNARREAHRRFLNAVEAANQLDCPSAARVDDEYALWLELMDPAQTANAKKRLETKLRDPASELGIVRLGLQFGVKLDLERVEREILKQVALNGGMTMDAAVARFALAFTQETPEDSAKYIARYYDELAGHIDTKAMQLIQLEMNARAGLSKQARGCLDRLIEQGISPDEEERLRRLIAEADGGDPIEARKEQYRKTNALPDLFLLVEELEAHEDWEGLSKYGEELFEQTRSLPDAERLVNALNNAHQSAAVVEFLTKNSDLLPQSKNLQMSFAWGLFNEGSLVESRAALAKLADDSDSQNYRALHVSLGIAMGDWSALSEYVASEYRKRENRSARDLIGLAQLALQIGSPHAKDCVLAAAANANDDANILAGAYFLASNAGWEDDPAVYEWLDRAARLSGEDGPLQRMSLKDILERKPEWDRRESETWRLLGRGEIPIFLAAQSLNRSLIDLTISPALANLSQSDPRRRSAISAYSGNRIPGNFNITETTAAIDATALLTLSFLGILEKALDAFQRVYIPHSTLSWLFEERQKSAFHQPTRVQGARKVRDLLSQELIEKFVPSTVASSDLAVQVGDDLAVLIAEAEKVRENDDAQRIVVRSSPVHRVSSLMEEEADLSSRAAFLSSCLAVVVKLRQKGQITAEEEKRAQAYLQLHEKPWTNQPEISDGAILYLDDLAVTYLLHLGLLEKIKSAGLTAVISKRAIDDSNELIAYERNADDVKNVIEQLRVTIRSRIESGQVAVGPSRSSDTSGEDSVSDHPTAGIIALAPLCDATIVDDRFFNQHARIDYQGNQVPTYSTLDVLGAMLSAGAISEGDFFEFRTRLRRAGYFFVPVDEDELKHHLNASVVGGSQVIETAELKAIRESVLRVRMSDWLQLPKDAFWLDTTLKAHIRVLKGLWVDANDVNEVTVRSDWIAEQVDVRGWAHSFNPEIADNVVRIGRGEHILLLLSPPLDSNRNIVIGYWEWVEEKILAPIKEQFPDLYAWLVTSYKSQVAELSETKINQESTT